MRLVMHILAKYIIPFVLVICGALYFFVVKQTTTPPQVLNETMEHIKTSPLIKARPELISINESSLPDNSDYLLDINSKLQRSNDIQNDISVDIKKFDAKVKEIINKYGLETNNDK